MQLIKEYKSNVLVKTISGKALNKLHLTKILKNRFFDHHPITYENLHKAVCKELGQN